MAKSRTGWSRGCGYDGGSGDAATTVPKGDRTAAGSGGRDYVADGGSMTGMLGPDVPGGCRRRARTASGVSTASLPSRSQ